MPPKERLGGGDRGGVGALLRYAHVLAGRFLLLSQRGAVGEEVVVADADVHKVGRLSLHHVAPNLKHVHPMGGMKRDLEP